MKPNDKLYLINFIFNEVPDRISKVLCSLQFTADLFTNKAQFEAGFSEILKLKDDAVPDMTVMSHHTSVSNYFNYVVTITFSVITDCLILSIYALLT